MIDFKIKLTREQADKIFLDSNIIKTDIEQDKNELRLLFHLENEQAVLVKYDLQAKSKTYFSGDDIPFPH